MTYTTDWEGIYKEQPEAKAGMTSIEGDEWLYGAHAIIEGDEVDKEYFDTNLRYDRCEKFIPSLAVKVEITGRKLHSCGFSQYKIRCMITTWDDDEKPVSFRGWLYLWSNYE